MAIVKTIPQLPLKATPDPTDLVAIDDGTTTYKTPFSAFGGGGTTYLSKTYAQIATLIGSAGLIPGTLYKISDRGDMGLFFTAISTSELSKTGIRKMLCPADYAVEVDGNGNDWIGVWNSTKTVSINQHTIWGGLVWKNLTGAIGTASDDVTLDGTNWVVIPKASFTNEKYVEMQFGVSYDFANDWIERQWDGKSNIIGTSYFMSQWWGFAFNPCDVTDWNYDTCGNPFENNQAPAGIYNNSTVQGVYLNKICNDNGSQPGAIYNNSNGGVIANNIAGDISGNSNTQNINYNIVKGVIADNSNGISIYANQAFNIYQNSNTGTIYANNTGSDIAVNSNDGQISWNSNLGLLKNNSCDGDIVRNWNSGVIENNANNGSIENNGNLGDISNNTSDVTDIEYNNNNGSIDTNSHKGEIALNSNTGKITNCTSSVPVNIFNNINNGSIGPGTYVADVTDVIVNK